ncbi:MAG: type II CAAX endopeptidase family protein [Verrucomicrobiota bacterium]
METQAQLEEVLTTEPLVAGLLLGSVLLTLVCAGGLLALMLYLRSRQRLHFNQVLPLHLPLWEQAVIYGGLALLFFTIQSGADATWARILQLASAPLAILAVALAPRGLSQHYGLEKVSPLLLPALALLVLMAGFAIIFPANLISNLVLQGFGVETGLQDPVQRFLETDDPDRLMGMLFVGVIFAPIMEEVLFRGLLQPMLKAALGLWPAVLLTSLIFAAIHFHLPAFTALFVLAVIMSLAYEYTGSVMVCILIHMFFNAYQLGFMLLLRAYLPA